MNSYIHIGVFVAPICHFLIMQKCLISFSFEESWQKRCLLELMCQYWHPNFGIGFKSPGSSFLKFRFFHLFSF